MPQPFSRRDRLQGQHRGPSHTEHEALWGLAGATRESRLFDGGEVLIEVVQYLDPVGKPRPHDYRLSDQGILNIAFGARRKADFDAVYRRAEAFGAKPNCRPVHLPGAGSVVYVNDPHGFSVEILRTTPDWPTGSSDSSHDLYTSARIRIRAGSNTGSRSTHRPTKCGTRSPIKTTWPSGSVSTRSRCARKAGRSATAPVPNA